MDQQVKGRQTRTGVPKGWEGFPWTVFVLLRELGIEDAPVVVVAQGPGVELAFGRPGFRELVREVLARRYRDENELREALLRAVDRVAEDP